MLEEAYGQLENLNVTLRAQRHDFLNHMQVVGSLLEMQEYDEATRYIGRVYGDVLSVSSVLRTASPAVNALLQAKMAESERRGVLMRVQTESKWEGLPVQGWEMCRVLGNLIDNALDALKQTEAPCLTLTLSETRERFCFVLENNGRPCRRRCASAFSAPALRPRARGAAWGCLSCMRFSVKTAAISGWNPNRAARPSWAGCPGCRAAKRDLARAFGNMAVSGAETDRPPGNRAFAISSGFMVY